MQVLVTGATGFIGGYVSAALIDAGHEVTALVRASSSRDALAARGVRFAVGDVLDAATLRAVRMPARDKFVPDNRKPNAAAR